LSWFLLKIFMIMMIVMMMPISKVLVFSFPTLKMRSITNKVNLHFLYLRTKAAESYSLMKNKVIKQTVRLEKNLDILESDLQALQFVFTLSKNIEYSILYLYFMHILIIELSLLIFLIQLYL
jgi:hypothetical protein